MQEDHQRSFYRGDSPKMTDPTQELLLRSQQDFDHVEGARSFAQNY